LPNLLFECLAQPGSKPLRVVNITCKFHDTKSDTQI